MDERKLLLEFEKDGDWLNEHFATLQQDYAQKYVAVQSGKIVAAEDNFEELLAALKAKHIDPAFTLVRYIQKKGVFEIL